MASLAQIFQIIMIENDLRVMYVARCNRYPVMNDIPKRLTASFTQASVNALPLRYVRCAALLPRFRFIKTFRVFFDCDRLLKMGIKKDGPKVVPC